VYSLSEKMAMVNFCPRQLMAIGQLFNRHIHLALMAEITALSRSRILKLLVLFSSSRYSKI
jgi:hypothetical protein